MQLWPECGRSPVSAHMNQPNRKESRLQLHTGLYTELPVRTVLTPVKNMLLFSVCSF